MGVKYILRDLGWNEDLQKEYGPFKEIYDVGRVAVIYQNIYKILSPKGEQLAVLPGKMLHTTLESHELPAVGDWILMDKVDSIKDPTVIRGILQRKSKISRKRAGKTSEEQVIAVNIDIVFICMSLNQDFNLRRLERYLTLTWNSGAIPVVLLTKSDLCSNSQDQLAKTQDIAKNADVHLVSCIDKTGLDDIKKHIEPGKTIAFLGSSGVGKSSIINELLGEQRQLIREVSSVGDKGRHTTTNRELILLPQGGIVIDTPGMRELQLLDAEDSLDIAFDDIDELALMCKFRDCSHSVEPQCAVREAVEKGDLDKNRYMSYLKLRSEAESVEKRISKRKKSKR